MLSLNPEACSDQLMRILVIVISGQFEFAFVC